MSELALLPVFIAVAELGSFSAAAGRLRMDKSSVSRAIARLEEAVGARLVQRSTRRVALSSAGSALYARIAAPLGDIQDALGSVPGQEGPPLGRLRITAPTDFGSAVMADVVSRFVRRYPGVELDMQLSNDVQNLVEGGFDAGIRIASRRLRDSSIRARIIGETRFGIFASPAYLSRHGVPRTPADLADHEWIVFPSTKHLRLKGPEGEVAFVPAGRVLCNDMFFVRDAARHAVGLGVLPGFLAQAEVAAGELVEVLASWVATSGHIWFMTPAAKKVPRAVEAFRTALVESLVARHMAPDTPVRKKSGTRP